MTIQISNREFKIQAIVTLFDPEVTKLQFNEVLEERVTEAEVIEIANGLINLNETELTQLIINKITDHYAISI